MKTIKLSAIMIFMLMLSIAFSACGGDSSDDSGTKTNVYAGGYSEDENGGPHACLWKNGILLELENQGRKSTINSITESEGVIYAGGYCKNASSIDAAGYWIDGTWKSLEASSYSEVFAIAIAGSDVYAGGYIYDGSKKVPGYWKNDTWNALVNGEDSANEAAVRSIAVSGTDVYAGGYCYSVQDNGDADTTNDYSVKTAGYWEPDGTWNALVENPDSQIGDSEVYTIIIDGSDIYAGGYYNTGSNYKACYWKNGTRTDLENGVNAAYASYSYSLVMDESNIYAGGYGGGSPGCYWTSNGSDVTWTALYSAGDSSYYSIVRTLYPDGSDLYAAGAGQDENSNYFACYWKNGEWVDLGNEYGAYQSEVQSIIVTH